MFSIWNIAVNNAMYAVERGDDPAVFLGPGTSYWAEQQIRFVPDFRGYYGFYGNAWDYFFEPVGNTHVSYLGDQHVMIMNGPLSGMVLFYGRTNRAVKWSYDASVSPYYGMNSQTHLLAADFDGDYSQSLLTPEHRRRVNAFVRERIRPRGYLLCKMMVVRSLLGDKCLGVHYRNLSQHQIDLPDYYKRVDCLMETGNYERIFLATDSEKVREQFEARYPTLLCLNHTRRDDGNDVHQSDTSGPKIGEEVILDVYTLAACKHCVVGYSNVAWALPYLNPDLTWDYVYGRRDITRS
jgi:hypothetical protein